MWRAAKALLVAMLVIVGASAIVLSTTTGQSFIMRQAVGLLGDGKIAIGELNGSLFGTGSLKDISLSDADGQWLSIRGISFSWSPSQLLSGRLHISHARVESVRLARLPSSEPPAEQPEPKSSLGLPLAVRIGELDVKSVDILEAVAGEAVQLRISGSADINDAGRASDARLTVARLDGAKGEILAEATYSPERRVLAVNIDGNEPEGGTVSWLLGMPSRPPISLKIAGSGSLDAWRADLRLAAGDTPFIAGAVRLDALGQGLHRLNTQVAGYVDRLLPEAAAQLFAGRTDISLAADVAGLDEGLPQAITAARLEMTSHSARLTATGGADLSNRYLHGKVAGRVQRDDGRPLTFADTAGRAVTVREINLQAALPDTNASRQLTATAAVSGLVSDPMSANTVTLVARAVQPAPSGERASVLDDINIAVTVDGIAANAPLENAVGQGAQAKLVGAYDGSRLTISALDLDFAGAQAKLSGILEGEALKGTAQLSAADLSRYAALAGRPLKGTLTIGAQLEGNLGQQVFSATITGQSDRIATGTTAMDGLLAPLTHYGARIEGSADGTLALRDVMISNTMLSATLSGHHGPRDLALSGNVNLASLSSVDPKLTGKAQLSLDIGGSGADLSSRLTLTGDGVTFDGKAITEPRVSFSGRGPQSGHTGQLSLSAHIAGETVKGAADISLSDSGPSRIDGLDLKIAGARLAGDLAFEPDALPSGRIKIDAQDLGRLGSAIGMQLKGRIAADAELTRDVDNGRMRFTVAGDGIVAGDIRVEGVRSSGEVSSYLAAPDGTVDMKVSRIAKAGKTIGSIALDARLNAGATTFKSRGQLHGGAFAIAGKVQSASGSHDIELETVSYAGGDDIPRIALVSPGRLSLLDGRISTRSVQLAIGSGSLRVAGSASGEALDLSVMLKRLPAAVAAAVAPELGLAGTVDGAATIKGAPSKPLVSANIAAIGLSVRDMRERQLPSIDVTTNVTTADGQAKLGMKATARGGLEFAVEGTVGLDSNARLALAGRGKVPLSLANVFLADRSARMGGVATLTADVTGQISDPRVDGRLLLNGATANDPASGLDLNAIDADVGFTANRVDVRRFVARSKKGGEVTASGSVLLRHGDEAAMELGVELAAFKFGDQDPVSSELDGNVVVSGPLSALVAKGEVLIKRMDITVPNKMPQSVAALDIRHVNAPKRFQSADRRDTKGREAAPQTGPAVSLSVDVQAHDRIFVRGRGVDAQLGGLVKIRGTADRPVTDGQFSMTRGRLSIIGRQLDFSRGNIVFMGSVEPTLDMVAAADIDGTTVTVTVSGQASNPQFKFSSTPELPEDEIVSLLLFNKQLASLSPAQLVTLAGEIDKIGGLSSGPGTLDKMKAALGIDVLDVTTDKNGNAQATAGSYINEKTYVGVKQGMSLGDTRVVIDHNLSKHLKARGEMGTDGDSKLGLGVEWDY